MSEGGDDPQSFWATVHTVKALEQAMSATDQPIGADADLLMKVLDGTPWQLNAAFRLKPTVRTLVDRGFAYRKMKHLRKAITDQSDAEKQREEIENLTRTLGLLEFGVAVNEQWFRRLDGLIASDEITKSELKKLLKSIEVMWNKEGELVVQKFNVLTRSVIGIFLIFMITLAAILFFASMDSFQKIGFASHVGWLLFFYFIWSLWPTWCVWLLGPRSWSSSKKLQQLLTKQVKP